MEREEEDRESHISTSFRSISGSLCHLCITAIHLSYRFPTCETSATALRGPTGIHEAFVIEAWNFTFFLANFFTKPRFAVWYAASIDSIIAACLIDLVPFLGALMVGLLSGATGFLVYHLHVVVGGYNTTVFAFCFCIGFLSSLAALMPLKSGSCTIIVCFAEEADFLRRKATGSLRGIGPETDRRRCGLLDGLSQFLSPRISSTSDPKPGRPSAWCASRATDGDATPRPTTRTLIHAHPANNSIAGPCTN